MLNLFWWWRRQIFGNYTFLWTNLNVTANLSSVLMLRLHLVFFFSMSVCNSCFKFSRFEKPHSKIFEQFLPVIFQTSKQSVKFSFFFSYSKHFMNPVFSFFFFFAFLLLQEGKEPQAMILSSSQRSIPTTVESGSSTLEKRQSVDLLD